MKKLNTKLYFITDSTNYSEEEFLFRVEEALKGGATLVQLREKDKTTIKEINSSILNLCYSTFYHPSNMYLVVVGDIDVDTTLNLIKANQSTKDFPPYLNPQVVMQPDTDVVYKKYDIFHIHFL